MEGNFNRMRRVALSSSQVERLASDGDPVVWVKNSLAPTDVSILERVVGIVTRIGGPTSHLVVMARGRGIATFAGLQAMELDPGSGTTRIGSKTVREGEWVVIDEGTGSLYLGRIESERNVSQWASEILNLTSATSRARVLVNADVPADAQRGFGLGAGGVGLCRSENHLVAPDSLMALQCWLIGRSDGRINSIPRAVLEALREGLAALLRAAAGRRIQYRLFDAHLEDLLPLAGTEEACHLAQELCLDLDVLNRTLFELRELGGPHGFRGCRWGIQTGFYRQQLRIVAEVAHAAAQSGVGVQLAIIVPMVSVVAEFEAVQQVFRGEMKKAGIVQPGVAGGLDLRFGCMVETPRACTIIEEIARNADVLCFGTNDLTGAVWAISRDSGRQVLAHWLAEGIVDSDPFVVLDQTGVGSLITNSIARARSVRPDVNVVVCGEQANDPGSAAWLVQAGVDQVSCRADAVPAVALAIVQSGMARSHAPSVSCGPIPHSAAAEASDVAYERIRHARAFRSRALARRLALEWGASVSARLSMPEVGNWKFFKRDVIQHWFGKRECQRFPSGWSSEEVLQYALKHRGSGRAVRYSLFPSTIACHALSRVLDDSESVEAWRREIESLDHEEPIEVFPQQPPTQVCFRAVFWGSHMDLEAGIGQAMYVFEEERGQHPTLRAVIERGGECQRISGADRVMETPLELGLRDFVEQYGKWLYLRLWDMSVVLGSAWLGIEGYYDPDTGNEPFVCDLDLPQDLAFLGVE